MRVRVLGPVDVVDASGSVLAVGSPLRKTLLSLLALHAGTVLSADWLIEHVWDGDPPESGVRALRFHISRLRKELGDGAVLETRGGGYRLSVARGDVDALDVDERVRAARAGGDATVVAKLLAGALELWRGTPFVDAAQPCG